MSLSSIKDNLIPLSLRHFFYNVFSVFFRTTRKSSFASAGSHVELNGPLYIDPKQVHLEDYVRLQPGIRIIGYQGQVYIKKYTAIGAGSVLIPGAHTPTVGVPQFLSTSHVNDNDQDIYIEEDCWIGAGAYILSRAKVGRGSIVAASAVVTKPVPPYAVVAGSPARVVAARFSIEQILRHESILYPPKERLSREDLETLFATHFEHKKTLGVDEISAADALRLSKRKTALGMRSYDLENSEQ